MKAIARSPWLYVALAGVPLLQLVLAALRARRIAAEYRSKNPDSVIKIAYLPPKIGVLLRIALSKTFFNIFDDKYSMFKETKDDTFAFCSSQSTTVFIGNPELIKEVVNRPRDFPKPIHFYGLLDVFGRNIVTMEGEEWRAHRKIVAPNFSENNNMLVHDETLRALDLMFASWDQKASEKLGGATLVSTHDDTCQLALMIISGAAFGIKLQWEDSSDAASLPPNHKLSFQRALKQTTENMPFYILLPKFLFSMSLPWFSGVNLAMKEFQQYLNEIIDDALQSQDDKARNLLQMLTRTAAEEEESSEGGIKMSRSELLGNAFIFLFAGHETTAGTLNYALANLAMYPEIQDNIYEEATRVYGAENGTPTFKQINELHLATAVGNETLRLYPPVISVPKWTGENEQRLGHLTLPPKTQISLVSMAAHTNPKVWGPDSLVFRPERFLDNKRAPVAGSFLPFSLGLRSCVGQRFAQIELAVALSVIVSRYKIELPADIDRSKIFDSYSLVTLRPKKPIKLIMKRR